MRVIYQIIHSSSSSFFKTDFSDLFLVRGKGGRKRGRETSVCERNTEPATFCFAGQCSTNRVTPVRPPPSSLLTKIYLMILQPPLQIEPTMRHILVKTMLMEVLEKRYPMPFLSLWKMQCREESVIL